MEKNVTLKLDENILKLCKFKAVEENKSLSKWLADLMRKEAQGFLLTESHEYKKAKEKALKLLSTGYDFGGKPLKREEIYERKSIR